ncbi:MAG: ABC transporter substrate-binding protein [Tissierella sp.]|nr:ABC transporter substrate-binding protein [Tissierella sp.]
MKKFLLILSIFILSISVLGCETSTSNDNNEINVGVSFYPMKDILTLIEDDIKEEGYELNIHEFSDYQAPNNLLNNKELDANMIQHDYFLQSFNQANDSDLVTVQPIYHATFALYSMDYTSIDEIPDGASITLPDDSTNLSRALYLLGQADLLTFKDNKTIGLTVDDIESNPKNLQLDDQVPLTSLAQRYTETGLAIMYPTYAKSLELIGDEQRLYVEKQDHVTKDYAISLVARDDNKDSEEIQVLIKHVTSDKVRQFLIDNYDWASSPAF